mmetsp:Transcript_12366/g.21130  ORF Transcript_12366/g.21130 Transcript_12366/m.21130 type:complete len:178 (+) Transcript_12366:122-655(+)|eukprot:CAMPEP_0184693026 /NCGR_PEP_ID=MMETSP0313-20130426/1335_1 /TAXON_ID=2792 /ORGANISM="Porphyridium aerugineum, Strain SAG 1380-2" /LENGTH=177 /DNA_ID=CAMNT_0027150975 /DNA_START=98 /DNA_END=631 /DNA_ORIENTATION=-
MSSMSRMFRMMRPSASWNPYAMTQASRSAMPMRSSDPLQGPWASEKWVRAMRAQSGIDHPDDYPTKPLPFQHEIEGQTDFSNWIDRYEDISPNQVIAGFALFFGTMTIVYQISKRQSKKEYMHPDFLLRETPYDNDNFDGPQGKAFKEKFASRQRYVEDRLGLTEEERALRRALETP